MKRFLTRGAVAASTLAAAAAIGVLPAAAGNDSPNAPNSSARAFFCKHPEYWRVGVIFTDTSNDGRRGSWHIHDVVDSPQQTRFRAQFSVDHSYVDWYCR